MLYSEITDKIINSFYKVYNVLGHGFLEKVYENALVIELESAGFAVLQQQNIKVYYENQVVGDYYADIIVNDLIILEIKAAEGLRDENKAQLINYLKPVFERYQKISPTHNDSSCHQKILIQTVTLVSFKTVSNLSSVKSLI